MFGKCFNRSGGVYSIDLINYRLLENSCIKKKTTKERNAHKYFLNEITLHIFYRK